MAELPEVETMRRDLEREVVGRRVVCADVAQTRMMGLQTAEELRQRAEGGTFRSISRRGKYLLLHLDGDDTLLIHRGMTGNFLLRDPGQPLDPHVHLALTLDDGRQLRLCDARGFGEVRVLASDDVRVLHRRLGPEPLEPDFSFDYLVAQFGRRTALTKALLLNQHLVAGLGNIYVDESLWAAAIHPARRAHTLRAEEIAALRGAIVDVLNEAIERRGTTFSDYKDLYGLPGGNGAHLRIFHRAGQPCHRCGTVIQIIRAAGRGSSICPECQVL